MRKERGADQRRPRNKIYQDAADRDKKNFIRLIHSGSPLRDTTSPFPRHSTLSSPPFLVVLSYSSVRVLACI